MDPATAGLLAQGFGSLLDTGIGLWDSHQNRKMQRRQLRLQEKNSRFGNLIDLVQQGRALPAEATAMQRMIALRNAGG